MNSYIQFNKPLAVNTGGSDGLLKSMILNSLVGLLTRVIPKANPDFENKIDDVHQWLVECNYETGAPEREIGLDKDDQVILKMPYKDNYGYWTDNNLMLTDFKKHFVVTEITKEIFEDRWNELN